MGGGAGLGSGGLGVGEGGSQGWAVGDWYGWDTHVMVYKLLDGTICLSVRLPVEPPMRRPVALHDSCTPPTPVPCQKSSLQNNGHDSMDLTVTYV